MAQAEPKILMDDSDKQDNADVLEPANEIKVHDSDASSDFQGRGIVKQREKECSSESEEERSSSDENEMKPQDKALHLINSLDHETEKNTQPETLQNNQPKKLENAGENVFDM